MHADPVAALEDLGIDAATAIAALEATGGDLVLRVSESKPTAAAVAAAAAAVAAAAIPPRAVALASPPPERGSSGDALDRFGSIALAPLELLDSFGAPDALLLTGLPFVCLAFMASIVCTKACARWLFGRRRQRWRAERLPQEPIDDFDGLDADDGLDEFDDAASTSSMARSPPPHVRGERRGRGGRRGRW